MLHFCSCARIYNNDVVFVNMKKVTQFLSDEQNKCYFRIEQYSFCYNSSLHPLPPLCKMFIRNCSNLFLSF